MRIVRLGSAGVLVLILAGINAMAQVQKAPASPPTGAWSGKMKDQRTFILIVSGPSATLEVRPKDANSGTAITGPWSWAANGNGGVLTITYRNGNSQNRLSCTIAYVDAQTLTLDYSHTRMTLTRL